MLACYYGNRVILRDPLCWTVTRVIGSFWGVRYIDLFLWLYGHFEESNMLAVAKETGHYG